MRRWPDDPVKVAGIDHGPAWKRRGVWVASQDRDDCVIQAGAATPFWGRATEGDVVKLSFAGIEKTCTVGPGEEEWRIEVPPLPASAEPKTLKLLCERDGEYEKGTGPLCRNGPDGASHKLDLSPFRWLAGQRVVEGG